MSFYRRSLMKWLSLSGLNTLLTAPTTSFGSASTEPALPAAFEAAIQHTREASIKFGNGDPEAMKLAYSQAKDALIISALGGYEQGGDKVAERLEWAAKHFHDTRNQSFVRLAAACNSDLGYEVFLEKSESSVADGDTFAPTILRVTHIFRREAGLWKLVQRHADFLKPRA